MRRDYLCGGRQYDTVVIVHTTQHTHAMMMIVSFRTCRAAANADDVGDVVGVDVVAVPQSVV